MYFKDLHGQNFKDDADFDELEEFDYINSFVEQQEEPEHDSEIEEVDDLDDLFLDEDEEEDEENSLDYDLIETKQTIEIHAVCENCGHHWVDFISEEENETDFGLNCPLCGSSDVSRAN